MSSYPTAAPASTRTTTYHGASSVQNQGASRCILWWVQISNVIIFINILTWPFTAEFTQKSYDTYCNTAHSTTSGSCYNYDYCKNDRFCSLYDNNGDVKYWSGYCFSSSSTYNYTCKAYELYGSLAIALFVFLGIGAFLEFIRFMAAMNLSSQSDLTTNGWQCCNNTSGQENATLSFIGDSIFFRLLHCNPNIYNLSMERYDRGEFFVFNNWWSLLNMLSCIIPAFICSLILFGNGGYNGFSFLFALALYITSFVLKMRYRSQYKKLYGAKTTVVATAPNPRPVQPQYQVRPKLVVAVQARQQTYAQARPQTYGQARPQTRPQTNANTNSVIGQEMIKGLVSLAIVEDVGFMLATENNRAILLRKLYTVQCQNSTALRDAIIAGIQLMLRLKAVLIKIGFLKHQFIHIVITDGEDTCSASDLATLQMLFLRMRIDLGDYVCLKTFFIGVGLQPNERQKLETICILGGKMCSLFNCRDVDIEDVLARIQISVGIRQQIAIVQANSHIVIASKKEVVVRASERKFLVLFTLDKSGSMAGGRWRRIIAAVESFLKVLGSSDIIGCILFNDKATIIT